jgi:hypothetical protein
MQSNYLIKILVEKFNHSIGPSRKKEIKRFEKLDKKNKLAKNNIR